MTIGRLVFISFLFISFRVEARYEGNMGYVQAHEYSNALMKAKQVAYDNAMLKAGPLWVEYMNLQNDPNATQAQIDAAEKNYQAAQSEADNAKANAKVAEDASEQYTKAQNILENEDGPIMEMPKGATPKVPAGASTDSSKKAGGAISAAATSPTAMNARVPSACGGPCGGHHHPSSGGGMGPGGGLLLGVVAGAAIGAGIGAAVAAGSSGSDNGDSRAREEERRRADELRKQELAKQEADIQARIGEQFVKAEAMRKEQQSAQEEKLLLAALINSDKKKETSAPAESPVEKYLVELNKKALLEKENALATPPLIVGKPLMAEKPISATPIAPPIGAVPMRPRLLGHGIQTHRAIAQNEDAMNEEKNLSRALLKKKKRAPKRRIKPFRAAQR